MEDSWLDDINNYTPSERTYDGHYCTEGTSGAWNALYGG